MTSLEVMRWRKALRLRRVKRELKCDLCLFVNNSDTNTAMPDAFRRLDVEGSTL